MHCKQAIVIKIPRITPRFRQLTRLKRDTIYFNFTRMLQQILIMTTIYLKTRFQTKQATLNWRSHDGTNN